MIRKYSNFSELLGQANALVRRLFDQAGQVRLNAPDLVALHDLESAVTEEKQVGELLRRRGRVRFHVSFGGSNFLQWTENVNVKFVISVYFINIVQSQQSRKAKPQRLTIHILRRMTGEFFIVLAKRKTTNDRSKCS